MEYIKHIQRLRKIGLYGKNDGSSVFEQQSLEPLKPRKQEHLGEMLHHLNGEKHLENKELSRFWNLCPDNLEACTLSERILVPSLHVFLEEQALASPPVDPESKVVNNPNDMWQVLWLLSHDSAHFFQYVAQACADQAPARVPGECHSPNTQKSILSTLSSSAGGSF